MGRFPLEPGVTVDQITEQFREEEAAAEERKWREYYSGKPPRSK